MSGVPPISPQSMLSPTPPPQRASGWGKWLVIVAIVFGLGFFGMFATCLYIGIATPGTKVLPGRQLPSKYKTQIGKLGILEPGERIEFFYSDGFLDIEEGFYLLTDRRVVIYSKEFDDPALLMPYEDIEEVDADFSDSWIEDSWINLTLADGTYASFPASTEGGGDRKMFAALEKHIGPPDP